MTSRLCLRPCVPFAPKVSLYRLAGVQPSSCSNSIAGCSMSASSEYSLAGERGGDINQLLVLGSWKRQFRLKLVWVEADRGCAANSHSSFLDLPPDGIR